MKRFRLTTGILIAISLLFSSCSKEEEPLSSQSDQATISFNALLNDLMSKQNTKQSADVPECSSGIPAYVDVILSRDDVFVVGTEEEPLRIALNPNATDLDGDGTLDYFTRESGSLELSPGTYMLEYFTVLDEDGNVLWIAPIDDGTPGGLDELVDAALPLEINLGAGVKKYVDVGVVCFDDRMVALYGYLFFDLNGVEVIEFCIFGNYCDETGRHAEYVRYSVDVWKYGNSPLFPRGELLYEDLENGVIVTDYEDYADTAAEPLCINLPDGPGLDEYYIEITMIEPGTENEVIRSGLISDVDVRNLFSGDDEVEYFHFREGNCSTEDSPVLLSDPRDLTAFVWDFHFIFNDRSWDAEVTFHPDGTASYTEPAFPGQFDYTGYWSFFDNWLFYDMRGDGAPKAYYLTGELENGEMSGTYTYNDENKIWTAVRK